MDNSADPRLAAGPEESWFLEAAFTPGSRLGTLPDGPTTSVEVVEVVEVTTIRLPSGRLVVDEPWPKESDPETGAPAGRELAERIPPGAYRVEAAWTEATYEFMGERFDGREVAAVRLRVTDDPVARWELALGVEDDIERVQPDDRIGFSSETNMGSFADATGWPVLTAPFREFWHGIRNGNGRPRATENLGGGSFERTSDEALAADLVTFPVDSGSVIWLGRTAAGGIATVVAAADVRAPSR